MNHLYNFTNGGEKPWAAISLSVSTGGMPGAACAVVRKGSASFRTYYTASELRFIAMKLWDAAKALEETARDQNDAHLDKVAA